MAYTDAHGRRELVAGPFVKRGVSALRIEDPDPDATHDANDAAAQPRDSESGARRRGAAATGTGADRVPFH